MPADALESRTGPDHQTVTRLLLDAKAGNRAAFDRLFPLLYQDLREAAERQRYRWQGDATLDTTALVHEAYLRLVDQPDPRWECRAHFLSVASRAMRQILIDYAKRRRAAKRGGGSVHVRLEEIEAALTHDVRELSACDDALVALDESLRRLASVDERQSRIVECRFFGDMTVEETADALDISPATVKRAWAMAQAWLYRDLRATLRGTP